MLEIFRRLLRSSESLKQWFEHQRTRAYRTSLYVGFKVCAARGLVRIRATACYALVLKFVPPAGRVCGVATHAVGGSVGYSLLVLLFL